ncbi:hypothetical protein JNUCC1_03086 [Lentibacillus sp. JNUCC-1]|uniref:helix-turn-helix transcriptional regulator n=1 Tax=Lentibacillus sp. JNUCC-1 TaxID=2654513 RepID=UPI0012E7BAE9|nr:DeoR family transcriptional regulator [Lentibacillus sp. JNUCC-1]MUV39213.1 hypothetical protein [Lentibacillus sp. JNUCC-1]
MNKLPSTKQKLLNVLKKTQPCTIDGVMLHFSISEVAVRKHLGELERQGFIERRTLKQKIGRPLHEYRLTDKGHSTFPNQYEQLPVELLKDLEAVQGREAVHAVLNRRKEREQAHFDEAFQVDDFDEKIAQVTGIQNEKGYMVEAEQKDEGLYELTHYHCPIIKLAEEYGQVCLNEKEVFTNIFAPGHVEQQSCITKGDGVCKWTIKETKEG